MSLHESLLDLYTSFHSGVEYDVNFINTERMGWTVLHYCCIHNIECVVEYLLSNPQILVNVPDDNNCTPMLYACCNGRTQIIKMLFKFSKTFNYDINVNTRDTVNRSPLFWAVVHGHTEIVKILIVYCGKNLNIWPKGSYDGNMNVNARELAVILGHSEIIEVLDRFTKKPKRTQRELKQELDI